MTSPVPVARGYSALLADQEGRADSRSDDDEEDEEMVRPMGEPGRRGGVSGTGGVGY